MCMFALTVSTVEPKNIKEAMADSAWIEDEGIDFEESQLLAWKLFGFSRRFILHNHMGSLILIIQKNYRLRKALYGLKQAPRAWVPKKQDCTAMSSVEAEYVALSASCAPLHCNVISRSGVPGVICKLCSSNHSRTKNIHTRYHFIKEQVENGIIELYFIRTEYQLADMFTKALPKDRFQYLVNQIGMRCLTLAELEGNVQINSDSPTKGNFPENISQGQPDLRRSSRIPKMTAKFNDYVVNNSKKLIGKLIYLTNTRPDIAYVVHCLSQFMHSPLNSHLDVALRVLRYLKGSPGSGIHINKNGNLKLRAYAYSDWVRCP
nr:ribonuclease H-like domain-containing protein [Tanacetum cinerariifolium]